MENRKRVLIEAAIARFTQKEMCISVEAIVAYLNSRYSITKFSADEVAQVFRENAGGAA
jgi:hypothetical protein